ncbi:MAG: VOC family protein [Bacteroidota bacterium]|nr:VOC family protein [Bacteroidota bacterium]
MLKKLRTIIYHVSDIAVAKDWYRKATGIDPYFDEPFYAGFDINGYELGLDPDTLSVVPGNQTVSYWAVDDTDAAAKKLAAIGGHLVQPGTNVGGEIFVAIVGDPFGNHIGLIEGA